MEKEAKKEQSLAVIKKEINKAENISFKKLKVNSQPTLERAKEARTFVKGLEKRIKEAKENAIDPLKKKIEEKKEIFKPLEVRITAVIDWLDKEMLAYNDKLKKESAEKSKELESEITKGNISFEKAAEKIVKIEEKQESIKTRKNLRVRVTDFSIVPDEFKCLNEKEALSFCREKGNANDDILRFKIIKGLEFYYEETITE